MKGIFKLLVLLCFNLSVFAQENNLFLESNLSDAREADLKLIGDFSILELDEAVWNDILDTHPTSLRLEIPFNGDVLTLNLDEVSFIREDFVIFFICK